MGQIIYSVRGYGHTIVKILHFADVHLGVESYGRIDPATGLSSRFLDFTAALDQLVDYALKNKVDLVLFCGDAYKSRDPSQTQQREFAKRINRLSSSGISIFLLIGNHDLPNAIGRATSTEIFDTLAVKNVYVSNRPEIYHLPTNSGTIQIASLPWLRRSALLSKEETKNINFDQINQKLQQVLTNIVATHAAKLDLGLPSILAAHSWHPVPLLIHSKLTLGEGVEAFHERACGSGSLGRIPATQVMLLALAHAGKLAKFGP